MIKDFTEAEIGKIAETFQFRFDSEADVSEAISLSSNQEIDKAIDAHSDLLTLYLEEKRKRAYAKS
jgi:hypothetical protein